ncbi:MAG: hypothetical protein QGG40_09310, partial [Myxococcota bacterium]|nr:hypothetical protein [Myxococcota bacterium]
MPRWLVTQGDHQFAAQDLTELKKLASDGRIGAGDMIQPPGASDWLYATEIPELKDLLQSTGDDSSLDDDFERPARGKAPLLVFLLAILVGGAYFAQHYVAEIRANSDLSLLGEQG